MKNYNELKKKAEELVSKLTTDEKIRMLTTHQHEAERPGITEFISVLRSQEAM